MDEMAQKYPVDGVPTSLADLGYKYVGVDDHWQNCTTVCPNGTVVPSWKPRVSSNGNLDYDYQSCVNVTGGKVPGSKAIPWYSDGTDPSQGPYGTPQVDTHRFPDMKAMVAHGHSLGLRPGWCASLAVSARRQFHSTCNLRKCRTPAAKLPRLKACAWLKRQGHGKLSVLGRQRPVYQGRRQPWQHLQGSQLLLLGHGSPCPGLGQGSG